MNECQISKVLIARPLYGSCNCAGNELRLFGAKAFSLLLLLMSHI